MQTGKVFLMYNGQSAEWTDWFDGWHRRAYGSLFYGLYWIYPLLVVHDCYYAGWDSVSTETEKSKEYKTLLKNAIEKYENYEYRIIKVS